VDHRLSTDSKLKREVAIKVLPPAFTEDPERLARFEREAQLLAQLHHPSIAAIYGLEDSDGVRALVMELAPGPTLAERLAPGALPIEEALAIARGIAEALEAAHDKGIVHRDLKPQNVKAPVDGPVKVLDFGLAKAMDPTSAASGPTPASQLAASPTLTFGATVQGLILGTAAYMAPEQAKGMPVDKRADIWSFGVVLWEMLTGKRLFLGDSTAETLAAVIRADIDLAALPADTPAAIRRLLRRCLERSPKNRLHDIADARIVLEEVMRGDHDGETSAPGSAEAPRRGRWWAALVAALVVGPLGWLLRGRAAEEPPVPMRLSIQLSAEQELVVSSNATLAFSRDGASVVFRAREHGRDALFRRVLGESEVRRIEGTDNGVAPFLSPDGRWLGFVQTGKLMKVAIDGGRPFVLASARGAGGATWLPDDTLVFAPTYSDGLFRISAEGSEPERLTTPDRASGVLGHWWPDPLPGYRQVLFTAFRTPVDRSRIGVLDLESREVRWLVEGGFFARWSPSGHLLFAREGRLMAAPFDAETATVTGPAVAMVDDLRVVPIGGWGQFALSSRGTLAYVSETVGNARRGLVWIDRDGRVEPLSVEANRFVSVSLSPDDRQVAVAIQESSLDLWIYSLDSGTLSRLTSSEGTEFSPVWAADGRELIYVFDRPPFELRRLAVGFPDSGRPVWEEPGELDITEPALGPGGRIAFTVSESETGYNVYSRPAAGGEPARPIRATGGDERFASFSPDGRWVVYQSDETGRPEIYVEPLPGPGQRVQVSADGGLEPVWARNGEIFFRHLDQIRVAATRLGETFQAEPPRTLFAHPMLRGMDETARTWDVTADGRRVIAISVPEANRPRRIEIVTDWLEELEESVPRSAP
jgi:serine/threonine-protein kinase